MSRNVKRVGALLLGCGLAGAPLVVTAQIPAKPAAVPGKSGNTAEKAHRTAEILVSQGLSALAAGDIKAARDCFVDVLGLEPRNRKSLEGLGYCYLKLDDIQRASRSLEGALAVPEPINRPLAMNLAFSLLRSRNSMRGAKVLRDYLASQPGTVDEEALNAMAICLGQASDEARVGRLFPELVKFYDEQNTKLEATRSGQKRWGIDWIPQGEWEVKESQRKSIQKRADAKWTDVVAANREYQAAKSRYDNAYANSRFRKTNDNLGGMLSDVKSKASRAERLQGEYNEIIAKIERPKLPSLFAAIPLTEDATMVASADSASAGVGPTMPPSQGSGSAPSRGTGAPGSRTPGVGSPGIGPVASTTPPSTPPASPPTLARPIDTPPATPSTQRPTTPPPANPPTVATVDPPAVSRPTPTKSPSGSRSIFTYATGFAVSMDLLVTSADCVDGATRINVQPTTGDMLDAEVVKVDPNSGLALIRIKGGRMPYVGVGQSFNGGTILCPGFPVTSLFDPESEVIAGSAAPVKDKWTIRLSRHPRLAGSPILSNNMVVGVELAARESDVTTVPAVPLKELSAFLADQPLPAAPGAVDPKAVVGVVTAMKNK